MGGVQSHNPNNAVVVTAEGGTTPSNESPSNVPYTESNGGPKPPYTPLDVWVKWLKYSDGFQRE